MDLDLFEDINLGGYFLKIIGVNVLGIIILLIGRSFFPNKEELVQLLILVGTVLITIQEFRKNNISPKKVFADGTSGSYIIEAPFALILTNLASAGILFILAFAVFKLFPHFYQSFDKFTSDADRFVTYSIWDNVIIFIESVLIAPILEEIVFRGILFTRFRSKYGIIKAMIFSSLLFFALHFTLNPSPFIVAITNCILVLRYKSLIPGMVVHFLNNTFCFVMKIIPASTSSASGSMTPPTDLGDVVIGIIMLSIYIIYIYKTFPSEKETEVPAELN